MKFKSSRYNVGYPICGAKFLNNSLLLVAGGHYETDKITILQIDFTKKKIVKRFREITLEPTDNAPTTLDSQQNLVLMGCNENSQKIQSGLGNHHIRKFIFENEHLRYVASVDFDRSNDPSQATKFITIAPDMSIAIIASSNIPTVLKVIDPNMLIERFEIETGREVKDVGFSPDSKLVGYITESTLEVFSTLTGRFVSRKTDFNQTWTLSNVKFLNDNAIIIVGSLKNSKGIVLTKISLKDDTASIDETKKISNSISSVTSMDIAPTGNLIGLSTNDNSLILLRLNGFKILHIFKQLHEQPITKVSFTPDSRHVATVSSDCKTTVVELPPNLGKLSSFFSKLKKLFLNLIMVVLLAYLAQLIYKHNLHQKTYDYILEKYVAQRDSSAYFNINDGVETSIIQGDIVSVRSVTHPLDTENTIINTSAFDTSTESSPIWLTLTTETTETVPTFISPTTIPSSKKERIGKPISATTTKETQNNIEKLKRMMNDESSVESPLTVASDMLRMSIAPVSINIENTENKQETELATTDTFIETTTTTTTPLAAATTFSQKNVISTTSTAAAFTVLDTITASHSSASITAPSSSIIATDSSSTTTSEFSSSPKHLTYSTPTFLSSNSSDAFCTSTQTYLSSSITPSESIESSSTNLTKKTEMLVNSTSILEDLTTEVTILLESVQSPETTLSSSTPSEHASVLTSPISNTSIIADIDSVTSNTSTPLPISCTSSSSIETATSVDVPVSSTLSSSTDTVTSPILSFEILESPKETVISSTLSSEVLQSSIKSANVSSSITSSATILSSESSQAINTTSFMRFTDETLDAPIPIITSTSLTTIKTANVIKASISSEADVFPTAGSYTETAVSNYVATSFEEPLTNTFTEQKIRTTTANLQETVVLRTIWIDGSWYMYEEATSVTIEHPTKTETFELQDVPTPFNESTLNSTVADMVSSLNSIAEETVPSPASLSTTESSTSTETVVSTTPVTNVTQMGTPLSTNVSYTDDAEKVNTPVGQEITSIDEMPSVSCIESMTTTSSPLSDETISDNPSTLIQEKLSSSDKISIVTEITEKPTPILEEISETRIDEATSGSVTDTIAHDEL
ncbi:GTPase-activating protein SED4 NDAI_0I00390 [Naumovozyma dairenensis CBS 421]|uniref:Guanine nucleotide-exchange factor SEC12 n=1 Tax=Naumovozyma dairenensis (strain ATCC 10597 / BCRC 20456 / CBS 421 / NBRC 0211 / NRRL Y-12639) TaxID=1071378 RepID=G0WFP7_NAUDC|nr:hypothetical protein NDAI_0I00390 [Naumovozyma dairenensis CBS 421]CCD26608.1 hypothetical protein NDAI_0I00390 [Naumovozyma dairenensis CBS 421]